MSSLRIGALVLPLLLGPLVAQAASYTPFSGNCVGGGLPSLTLVHLPQIGQSLQLQMMSGGANPGSYEGGGLTALVLGLSRTSWLGVPLPWTPSTIALLGGGACGDLMVSGDAVVNTPYLMPPALVTMSVVIPNVPALIGTTIYAQSIAYRVTRHFTFGIEFGDGGEARIGT